MATFDRFTPPNLPALSGADRTAFLALSNYLPRFEDHLVESGHFREFATIAERDDYFTDPVVGDVCIVSTDGSTASTLWVYNDFLTSSFNIVTAWLPKDLGWTGYAPTIAGGITLGDGSVAASYMRNFTECSTNFTFVLGATSAITGAVSINFPFLAKTSHLLVTNLNILGEVWLGDTGTANFMGQTRLISASAYDILARRQHSGGTYIDVVALAAGVPHIWAPTDQILVSPFQYEMDIQNIIPFTV